MQQGILSTNESSQLFEQTLLADGHFDNRLGSDTAVEKHLVDLLSQQLMGSYEKLEQRVNDLTSELESMSAQRLVELTEKERLANRLETLIQSLPAGVVVLDSSGLIVESNPTAEVLLEADLKNKAWRDVVAHCFVPREDDGHEVSNTKGRRISIVTCSLGIDGQIILLTDQTETRRLQAELSRNERLSALGKVVSTLAHQVRTPLSSAMLYANHLCENTLNDTQRETFSHKLKSRLEFMERQVRDMLLFVKGDIPLNDDITLAQLSQSLYDNIDPQLALYQAQCDFHVDEQPCTLKCNHDALIGAILNLVTNSLQATSTPLLNITMSLDDKYLIIQIVDNGPGIPLEKLRQVNDLFFTTKEQGTGIGLPVVKHIVEAHGGRFILSNSKMSPPYTGLCAQIYLPMTRSN